MRPTLREAVAGLRWIHAEVRAGRRFPGAEARLVTHTLQVDLQNDGQSGLPLLELEDAGDYTLVHAINVSVLAMTTAEALGLDARDARALGTAALLHDVGTLVTPVSLLTKPGQFTPEEREVVKRHVIDGARLLLEADENMDLAAVVAYEHHIRMDGGGYPVLTYSRTCHFASRLAQVCDVFDALRTKRPHKDAWPLEIIRSYLSERSGFDFDAEVTRALMAVVQTRGLAAAVPATSA